MKNFDWESFKEGKIVVHCKTKKEAEDFCLQMHEHGMTWESGNSYLSYTYYEVHKNKTCYSIGGYQSCDYFEKYRCNILEWGDYMQKEFTKADLKDGMVVEQRDGDMYLVLAGTAVRKEGQNNISGFTDDLKWEGYAGGDIIKIYRIIPESLGSIEEALIKNNLELIWERKEPKKMTVEEMRQKLEELTGEEIEVME